MSKKRKKANALDLGITNLSNSVLTLFLLWIVACAGFTAGAAVGMINEFMSKTRLPKKVPDVPELIGMIAVLGVPQLLTLGLLVKVCITSSRSPFLGQRKNIWLVLLPIAYGIGLGCVLLVFR